MHIARWWWGGLPQLPVNRDEEQKPDEWILSSARRTWTSSVINDGRRDGFCSVTPFCQTGNNGGKIKKWLQTRWRVTSAYFCLFSFPFLVVFVFQKETFEKLTSKPYLLEARWLATDPRVDYKENVMLSGVITGLACCFTPTSGVPSKTRKKKAMWTQEKLSWKCILWNWTLKMEAAAVQGKFYIFFLTVITCSKGGDELWVPEAGKLL